MPFHPPPPVTTLPSEKWLFPVAVVKGVSPVQIKAELVCYHAIPREDVPADWGKWAIALWVSTADLKVGQKHSPVLFPEHPHGDLCPFAPLGTPRIARDIVPSLRGEFPRHRPCIRSSAP